MTEDIVSSERELWNTAKIYSMYHVADPLLRCRKLIMICLFGVEEIGQEAGVSQETININKLTAIERLLQELKMLISQNKNFLKKPEQTKLKELDDRLEEVEEVIDGCRSNSTDQRNNSSMTIINQRHFNLCLKELREIDSEVRRNLGDLIFPKGDDVDIDKIKRNIIEGG